MGKVSVRGTTPKTAQPAPPSAGETPNHSEFRKSRSSERALLARGLRGLMGKSQARCRTQRTQADVQLVEYRSRATGGIRLTIGNTSTCKAVLCPQCAPAIAEVRSAELTQAITQHGPRRTYFLSLTHRHKKTQNLALQNKLLTTSWGLMFSGRKGRELSRRLGGPMVPPPRIKKGKPLDLNALVTPDECWIPLKPWGVRANDTTWSNEHGFHKHLHCLLFTHKEVDEAKVRWLIRRRWRVCLLQTIKNFKKTAKRAILEGEGVRDRVLKVFGQQLFQRSKTILNRFPAPRQLDWLMRKLFPRTPTRTYRSWIRRGRVIVGDHVEKNLHFIVKPGQRITLTSTIEECARRIRRRLKNFRSEMAEIDREAWEELPPLTEGGAPRRRRAKGWGHGVHVEQVRHASRIPRYLVKMGCELANMFSKMGRVSDDGITHYGLWELANVAADQRHPINGAARGAWRELYRATYATQTITWSQGARDHFELDAERTDEEIEQDGGQEGDDQRVIGIIEGRDFDRFTKREHQAFLARVYQLHEDGKIDNRPGFELCPEVAEFFRPATCEFLVDQETGEVSEWLPVKREELQPQPEWWQRYENETKALRKGRAPPQHPPGQIPLPDEHEKEARRLAELRKIVMLRGRTGPDGGIRPPPAEVRRRPKEAG